MVRPSRSLIAVGCVASATSAVVLLLGRSDPSPADPPSTALPGEVGAAVAAATESFVPNRGQWDADCAYVARFGPMTVFLERDGWSFTLADPDADSTDAARAVAVRMAFEGAGEPQLLPERRLPGTHHYLRGEDPAAWRRGVPLFAAVRYQDLYPGVGVLARQHDGHFEYDLLLAPDADLAQVEIAVEGVDGLRVADDGALEMATALGPVRLPLPPSWEEGAGGERHGIACRYELRGTDRFGFAVLRRHPDRTLVIDPGLLWSTRLGGSQLDMITSCAVDDHGVVTCVGRTMSPDFPTTPGALDPTLGGNEDAFVARLSADGSTLLWATYFGGSRPDEATVVSIDPGPEVTFAGKTSSFDLPTTPGAFDRTYNGPIDAFVARLSADGSNLVWSTYLGGTGAEDAEGPGLAVDASGSAVVVSETTSTNFPTTPGAFQTVRQGQSDAFVTRLLPDGSGLVGSTLLGGSSGERGYGVAFAQGGGILACGRTESDTFPTTPGAYDRTYGGGPLDGFVVELSPTLDALAWSTFLGGSAIDAAFTLDVGPAGDVAVVLETDSTDFPTTPGVVQPRLAGNREVGLSMLAPDGGSLRWSTFFGGTDGEIVRDIAVDARGATVVGGFTFSTDLPVTLGAYDRTHNGSLDLFVTRLSPAADRIEYSTYFGGSRWDAGTSPAIDPRGFVTIVGWTTSNDFPTTPGAYERSAQGADDGYAARLDLLPRGVGACGESSPGCGGKLPISVNSMPQVGNQEFAVLCGNAPASAPGGLLLGAGCLPAPFRVLGVDLWVDPTGPFFVSVPATSTPTGVGEVRLPIRATAAAGARLGVQFWWFGPSAPPPCPPSGFSTSQALEITVQPL